MEVDNRTIVELHKSLVESVTKTLNMIFLLQIREATSVTKAEF